MKSILFFKTADFNGATRVTQTIKKIVRRHYETRSTIITDLDNPEKEICEAIAKEQPDILFCSFSAINPEVITVGKENGLTVVVRQDYKLGDLTDTTKKRIFRTYTNADWIIAQTPEMKQEFQSYDELKDCRIKVFENPLDEEDILEKAKAPNPFPNNGNFHFLWVGRKDPIKDISSLQKAFSIVNEQYSKTDLTFVSDDPNPYRWMKSADCLVISSVSEASPNVLREALFLETKVISTDCSPTVRRLLPHNRIAKVRDYQNLADLMINEVRNNKIR